MTRHPHRPLFAAFVALALALTARAALAQAPAGAPAAGDGQPMTEEDLRDQMRQIRIQVMTNMAAKGIDPRAFMADVMSASPDGGFDMELLTEKLVENELIDRATIDRLQGAVTNMAGARLRRELGLTTDEGRWVLVRQRIQKVVDTAHAAGVRNPRLAAFGLRPAVPGPTPVERATSALQAAAKDPAVTPARAAEALDALRTARAAAKAAHAAAQQDLIAACTPRQEAVLLMMGLVE